MPTRKKVVTAGILVCLGISGCCHTRDVSSTPEFKPWIGKTVKLSGYGGYNVFAPTKGGDYFIDPSATYSDHPNLGKVPEGYPVVIEAVKKTEGTYLLMDGMHYTDTWLILSMEHPTQKNKQTR